MNTVIRIFEKVAGYFSQIAILILGIAAIALMFQIFKEEGLSGVWQTVKVDILKGTLSFIPVMMVFFTIMGALNHLQKRHSKEFQAIISGKSGTVKMVLLAAALPGPAGGQQLQDAWNTKGSNKTKLLLCLTGMMALNVNLILFRSKVLGGPLTLIWMCIATSTLMAIWLFARFLL